MTDAHAKAVEAGANWYQYEMSSSREDAAYFASAVVAAYLAAMGAAGWVMVRDVGYYSHTRHYSKSRLIREAYANGHNACRAAMFKGAGDGQG